MFLGYLFSGRANFSSGGGGGYYGGADFLRRRKNVNITKNFYANMTDYRHADNMTDYKTYKLMVI